MGHQIRDNKHSLSCDLSSVSVRGIVDRDNCPGFRPMWFLAYFLHLSLRSSHWVLLFKMARGKKKVISEHSDMQTIKQPLGIISTINVAILINSVHLLLLQTIHQSRPVLHKCHQQRRQPSWRGSRNINLCSCTSLMWVYYSNLAGFKKSHPHQIG